LTDLFIYVINIPKQVRNETGIIRCEFYLIQNKPYAKVESKAILNNKLLEDLNDDLFILILSSLRLLVKVNSSLVV